MVTDTGASYGAIARRIGAGGLVIALLFGIGSYVVGQRTIDSEIVLLAEAEARAFASGEPDLRGLLAGPARHVADRLQHFLDSRAAAPAGHFVRAALLDRERQQQATALRDKEAAPHLRAPNISSDFPGAHQTSHRRFSNGDDVFVEVTVPLHTGGEIQGYFSGVYHVAEAQFAALRGRTVAIVLAVVGIVLATTALLLPLVIALNHRVLRLSRGLLKANLDSLAIMGNSIAKRDRDTGRHNYRVTLYAVSLAEHVGLDRAALQDLIKGAFLHDVGKIAIPDAILLKPAKLDDEEYRIMQGHVLHGLDIIRQSKWLEGAACVVRHHHERYDGKGYPDGLVGKAIPIGARLFAIADVFDALTSKRPYKAALGLEPALQLLAEDAGRHFDPDLVAAFASLAPRLYGRYAAAGEDDIRAAMEAAARRYFGV